MATRGQSGSGVTLLEAGLALDGSTAWGTFTIADRAFAGWEVDVTLDCRTGDLIELGLSRQGEKGSGGITRRMVQRVPVGAIHRRLLRGTRETLEASASGEPVPLTTEDDGGRQVQVGVVQADTQMRALLLNEAEVLGGARVVAKAQLARDYVQECVVGDRSLADFAKARHYSASTISNRISGLRSEGYLPKLGPGEKNPGKPWGRETQKTTDILAAAGGGEG